MIQFHILDLLVPLFLIGFGLGFLFLLLGFWTKKPKYYHLCGLFLVIGIASFVGVGIAEPYPDSEDESVASEPIVEAVAPAEEIEEELEEERDIHEFSSDNLLTPAIFIAILEEDPLAEYGTYVFNDSLGALTFTIDMDTDLWAVFELAKLGDKEDYDTLKVYFGDISESTWEALEAPLAIINPEKTNNSSLLWYENGEIIFELIK